jgi:PPK2 family polyphosphate:nucleotide phosphotransferase
MIAAPERGKICIFNRSHYEDVLVVRVHPELLTRSGLPNDCITDRIWKERYEDINAFEQHLVRNGTKILKFFLHISKEEQRQRFLDRLNDPSKHWKFSASDVRERKYWDQYQRAYEDVLSHTSTRHAPWYVIPADNKWVSRALVAEIIASTISDLKLKYPRVDKSKRLELAAARRSLEREGS